MGKARFRCRFFAQLGRQTLSYDDERILGGLDWNVAGRYHDALKLGYAKNAHQLHFILAFNQNKEKSKGGTYYYDGRATLQEYADPLVSLCGASFQS